MVAHSNNLIYRLDVNASCKIVVAEAPSALNPQVSLDGVSFSLAPNTSLASFHPLLSTLVGTSSAGKLIGGAPKSPWQVPQYTYGWLGVCGAVAHVSYSL